MNIKKVMSVSLGAIISLLGGQVSAEKGDPYEREPWKDHPNLFSSFVAEEAASPVGGTEKPVYLVKKQEYDSSKEYREIRIWNFPALVRNDGLVNNFNLAIRRVLKCIALNIEDIDKYEGNLYPFVQMISKKIVKSWEIVNLANLLKEKPEIISDSLIYSLFSIPDKPNINYFGAIMDLLSVVLIVTGIVGAGVAIAGAVKPCTHSLGAEALKGGGQFLKQKATGATKLMVSNKDCLKNIGKVICDKMDLKPVGYMAKEHMGNVIWESVKAPMNQKLVCDGLCNLHRGVALAAVGGIGVAIKGATSLLDYVIFSSISDQFKKEKIYNYAHLFHGLRESLVNTLGHDAAGSNVLITAIDKRDFCTWLPWNRFRANKGSGHWFANIPGLKFSPVFYSGCMLDKEAKILQSALLENEKIMDHVSNSLDTIDDKCTIF